LICKRHYKKQIHSAVVVSGNSNGSGGSDDEDGAADVVEDEGIYSLSSDQLDVGELIAQTFWLELDWYPKKPGTDPMEFEISG